MSQSGSERISDNIVFGTRSDPDKQLSPGATASTRSGHRTVEVLREDGRKAYLHSRFDPLREARNQLGKLAAGDLDTVLLFGLGLGYLALELSKHLGPGNHLVVVERDPALFNAAKKNLPFDELLQRRHTVFLVGMAPDEVYDFLLSRMSLFLASGLKFVKHQPSFSCFPQYYRTVLKRINDFVRTGGVLLRTTMYLSRASFRNRARNLEYYIESPGIKPYEGRFAGKAGVVASAGPSLWKNMRLLREVKGRAPVVAVSTALKALLGKSIAPDFAVIIDYAGLSKRYFEDLPFAEQVPLVCDLKANAEAIAAYKGPKLFFDDHLMNTVLGGVGAGKGGLEGGSTVAHAAYNFVRYLGCDPVIFVGQDLAYTDGELHVPGTAVYRQSFGEFNRFYTPVMKELEYSLTMRSSLREVEGWDGGTVRTCEVFSTYLEEFERYFRANPEKVVDATEGGALKQNTERLTLRQAIDRYVEPELPHGLFEIPRFSAEEVKERAAKLDSVIERLLEESEELKGLYAGAIELVEEVLKKNRKGIAADRLVRKVLRIKEKLRRYGVLYFLLTNLAQSDLFIRVRRDRALNEASVKGVDRQRKQAERDLEYLKGLKHALEFFQAELRGRLRTPCGTEHRLQP